jgi:hypothetical protein
MFAIQLFEEIEEIENILPVCYLLSTSLGI